MWRGNKHKNKNDRARNSPTLRNAFCACACVRACVPWRACVCVCVCTVQHQQKTTPTPDLMKVRLGVYECPSNHRRRNFHHSPSSTQRHSSSSSTMCVLIFFFSFNLCHHHYDHGVPGVSLETIKELVNHWILTSCQPRSHSGRPNPANAYFKTGPANAYFKTLLKQTPSQVRQIRNINPCTYKTNINVHRQTSKHKFSKLSLQYHPC